MDLNRVELCGRISGDIKWRKKANGKSDWLSFALAVNDYDANYIEKGKSTTVWVRVAVFNEAICEYIRKVGIKVGTPVWLIGKLFVKSELHNNVWRTFTTVAVTHFTISKTKAEKDNTGITPPTIDDEPENDF